MAKSGVRSSVGNGDQRTLLATLRIAHALSADLVQLIEQQQHNPQKWVYGALKKKAERLRDMLAQLTAKDSADGLDGRD